MAAVARAVSIYSSLSLATTCIVFICGAAQETSECFGVGSYTGALISRSVIEVNSCDHNIMEGLIS